MKKVLNFFKKMVKAEKGQGMVEYGLIIGLISIALIAALVIFAPQIASVFESAGAALTGQASTSV